MKFPHQLAFNGLLDMLERQLRATPAGMKEYELMRVLRTASVEPFRQADLSDSLSLFQHHFLLFHCLYRLDQRLSVEGEGLHIHCLDIRLIRRAAEPGALAAHDPLREYYLDLRHLKDTDRSLVEEMLNTFWRHFGRYQGRDQALAVLELADPVDEATIRAQYRRLAMRHHPDRGGSADDFQRLREAADILL